MESEVREYLQFLGEKGDCALRARNGGGLEKGIGKSKRSSQVIPGHTETTHARVAKLDILRDALVAVDVSEVHRQGLQIRHSVNARGQTS